MRLTGKIAVVTGASMGIGEAIAARFVQQGASAVLNGRDPSRLEAARSRIGAAERTLAVAGDVGRRAHIDRLLASALERWGRVDIWVNNAGSGQMAAVSDLDMTACRRMFDTNLFAVIECMQAVVPVMRRQGSGAIINISSVAGHIAVPHMAAYGATKHALNCISKAARVELLGTGIHVMTVCPGYIATDFALNAVRQPGAMRLGTAARRGIPAARVADAVLRGYLRKSREIVVPWTDRLIIKLYQNAPALLEDSMRRMLRPAEQVIAEAQSAKNG